MDGRFTNNPASSKKYFIVNIIKAHEPNSKRENAIKCKSNMNERKVLLLSSLLSRILLLYSKRISFSLSK